jgi:catabolite regulation protein CreA
MALISCPDCQKPISDLAFSCLGCGRPMSATAQETGNPQRVLTEKTSKSYKAQQVISVVLAALSVLAFLSTQETTFLWLAFACVVWHLLLNVFIWWDHK